MGLPPVCFMRLLLILIPAILTAQSAPSNLAFETGTPGEPPPGWVVPQIQKALGYSAEFHREGCRSASGCAVLLAPAALPPDTFGNLTQSFDASRFRGKTVRLRAFVKVEPAPPLDRNATDHAQMWLRVDRPNQQMGFFDDMGDRPITSPEWVSYEITGEVAADADSVSIGVVSYGKSPVWIDGLSFEIMTDATSGSEVTAARTAIQKLYGRIDSAYAQKDLDAVASLALSDAQIHIGATRITLASALMQIMMEMEKGTGYASRSTITNVRLSGASAIVSVNNEASRTSPGGTQVLISANRDTWAKTPGGWKLKESTLISTRSVTPPTDSEAARPVVAELKQRAVPLDTAEPGGKHGDLAAFGKAVGEARIVALGEATDGTREFFQLKHRLMEYLVNEKGFTVFALEANWPESLAVDRYIKTGEGSAKTALASMYFWTWNTEEVLDLIEWMRSYNQAPGKHPLLSFTSFDMQMAHVAGPMALEYLGRYSPEDVQAAAETYTEAQMLDTRRVQIYDDQAKALADRAAAVLRVFDLKRTAMVAASSQEAWREARQAAVVVYQSCTMRIPGKGPSYRDEAMTDNVEWFRQIHPNEKIVLWAHNSHVSFGPSSDSMKTMGARLREKYGKQMYVVGFAFRQGRLRAVGLENGKSTKLSIYNAAPSPEGSGDAILSAAGLPLFFLDMATLPAGGQLSNWLAGTHLFHNVSANWVVGNADSNLEPQALSKLYDGLIFVEESHPARGLDK